MTQAAPDDLLRQATEQMTIGNYSDAEQLANLVVTSTTEHDEHHTSALLIIADSARMQGNIEIAFAIAQNALKLAETHHHRPSKAQAWQILGMVFWPQGSYDKALEYLGKAHAAHEALGDTIGAARDTMNIGIVYASIGSYDKALDFLGKALEVYEAIEEKSGIARVTGNIGGVYARLGSYDKALEYFGIALSVHEELGEKSLVARIMGNIGLVYDSLESYDLALEYHGKALMVHEELGAKSAAALVTGNIGSVYAQLGFYDKALYNFGKALAAHEELGEKSSVALVMANMGELYATQDYDGFNPQKAEEYMFKAVAVCEEIGSKQVLYNVHKSLADLYKSEKRWEDFATHFEKFYEIEKEVQSEETKKLSIKIAFERKVAEQENRIAIEQARYEEITKQKHILEEQAVKIQLANTELHEKNLELYTTNMRLEEANNFKMKILGIASHDLKNPITALNLYVQFLKNYTTTIPEVAQILESITASSKRMLDIVVNLIDVAARELGQIKLQFTPLDLAAVTADVIADYLPRTTAKKQTISFQFDNDCRVEADEQRLHQVLDNLISNAVKYSEHGKDIKVTVHKHERTVTIAVIDQGLGLSDEDKRLLFRDFQKLSARPTGGEGSTGLGLSVIKHLIELHSGRVWAESEGKGKGSSFFIELPISQKPL